MTEEGIDTGGKAGMNRKLVAGILALIIVISSVAGAYLLLSTGDKPFFQYSMSGMDGNVGEIGGIVVSDQPVLGEETSIIYWRNFDNAEYTLDDRYRMFQLLLPDSIELSNGSERTILEPGDPWNITWTIKPTQLGDFFVKIGYVIDPNTTRMYDESYEYYEMDSSSTYRLHYANIIGLRVGEDYGEIIDMGPGGGLEIEFEIYGYKEKVIGHPWNVYLYTVGDIVWLNITLTPIVDMPLTMCRIYVPSWDESFIEPVNQTSLKYFVNLSGGTATTLNYSFRILREMPNKVYSIVFNYLSEHGLSMITEEGWRDYHTGNIGFNIWTSLPERDGTRSGIYISNCSENNFNNTDINLPVSENGRRGTNERKKI